MKFQEINLSLPKEVATVYNIVSSIQPNSCIAGGFLSDLYLGKPYKDIDIFIKSDENKDFLIKKKLGITEEKSEPNEDYTDRAIFEVVTFERDGITFQLIFNRFGIKSAKFFDFRFREFFYFNEKCFASVEALSDIKKKKIVFGVTKNPLNAMKRAFEFKSRYEFSFEEENFSFFLSYISSYDIMQDTFCEFTSSKVKDKKVSDEILKFIREHKKEERFYFKQNTKLNPLIDFLRRQHVPRDQSDFLYDKYFHKINPIKKDFSFSYIENPFHLYLHELKIRFLRQYQKQKVRLLFLLNEKQKKKWTMFEKDFEKYANTWETDFLFLDIHHEKTHPFLQSLSSLLSEYCHIKLVANNFCHDTTITITNEIKDFTNISRLHLLKGELFKINVRNSGSFIIDVTTKNIVKQNLNSYLLTPIFPFVMGKIKTIYMTKKVV